ncbi:MAG: hypothetical protein SVY53_11525 [Chloroflexota bacterium]|nr:hypothetical protein [Chloroflexota bacterium]
MGLGFTLVLVAHEARERGACQLVPTGLAGLIVLDLMAKLGFMESKRISDSTVQ